MSIVDETPTGWFDRCSLFKCVCFHVWFQIIEALKQDEQAQKQKLAYKVEQIISAMSIES